MRQGFEPRDLFFFPRGIGGGQAVACFQDADGLGVLEPLCKREDEDRVETVDRLAVMLEKLGRLGRVCGGCLSQWPSL